MRITAGLAALLFTIAHPATAAVLQYGDKDLLGFGTYPSDPVTGAMLEGLAPGVSTVGTFGLGGVGHSFPFAPGVGDYPGTDQIYVGSVQTGSSDGYAGFAGRLSGPQVISLDYGTLVPAGESIATLTLGIGFDDFQFPVFGHPFSASVNAVADAALTALANSFAQTGPRASFASIGIDTALLTPDHVLVLAIDQGGTGGDGWAVDFLTVGVTTTPVPLPAAFAPALLALVGLSRAQRRGRRRA